MSENKTPTGAEGVLWDLSGLYKGIDDPQIEKDLETFKKKAKSFERRFKGKLITRLGDAIRAYMELTRYEYTLYAYPSLLSSCDPRNQDVKKLQSRVLEAINVANSQHLTFFYIEIAKMKERDYRRFLKNDADVAHHESLLDGIRHSNMLGEEAEKVMSLFSPFGSAEWVDLLEEMEADLRFEFNGNIYTLSEIYELKEEEEDPDLRSQIHRVINQGLKDQRFDYFTAKTFNVLAGEKGTSDVLFKYKRPISSINEENQVSDKTVDALHEAVQKMGINMAKKYYRLLSKHLNHGQVKPLRWVDSSAKLPFASNARFTWQEAVDIVEKSYRSFSPTLADLVVQILNNRWVDAPSYPGKLSDWYNESGPYLKGNFSYNFLNFYGSKDCVVGLAHELGHGVHRLLALEAQGPLMWHAPTIYEETASIFGEMLVFNHLLANCNTDEEKLEMLMNKISDFIGSVVTQIFYSVFEQRMHDMRCHGKVGLEDFRRVWLECIAKFYGKNGEIFHYAPEDVDATWSTISHFTVYGPFYVYSYAFGELFTQSLFAVKDQLGAGFEPKYLELLKSGNTKHAKELMAPFGLNPDDPEFWYNGMKVSVLAWLKEAERLTDKILAKNQTP